jgi:hypothetical protein
VNSRTRARWAALAVLATVTLAACGGAKGESTAGGRVDTIEELSKTLQISVPEGYMLQPDNVGDTGPTDLEKAVRDDGADDARDVLTRTRFIRGDQRMWSRSAADEIVAYVYQFEDAAGAAEYTKRLTADAIPTSTFRVDGINGAVGVNSAAPGTASSSVAFAKGPFSVEMVVNGSSPTGLQPLATALAEEQYSKL